MDKGYRIVVIPGGGTGPEVIAEGLEVLKAVAEKADITFDFIQYDFGGKRYMRTGEIHDSSIEELRQLDVIYLGAIGHSDVKPGIF